ncbi:MAG: hypothetical protein EBQ94_12655 [Flavobacteriales bacterium]|nr:hypothetical protein [Flavobacteriales bacterium]
MNWGAFTSVFAIATVKFMFSTFPGPHIGLLYYETFIAAFLGGTVSSAFFYFGSDLLMEWSHKRKVEKERLLHEQGIAVPHKKKFTKTNRLIIRLKMSFGIMVFVFGHRSFFQFL